MATTTAPAAPTPPRAIDPDKLNAFLNLAVGDMGAALHSAVVLMGDRLGLFRAMRDGTPVTSQQLSERTGVRERYVREWLKANAASKYVDYDAATDTYSMNPEQAFALAEDNTALDLPGFHYMLASVMRDEGKLTEAFRDGRGFGWHEHDKDLFVGCERFFRPTYLMHLVSEWLPALTGVEAKLKAGAKVADIGCGHGASTLLMAKAYPQSKFTGFDYHGKSIENARASAERQNLQDAVTFEESSAASIPGSGYDLVTTFDCLHDMGDPVGAAKHIKKALAPGGTWMIVEPIAGDDTAANLNPVGRIYYSASTVLCVPASLSQDVGLGLGAQAGEKRLREVLQEGGFSQVRRAAETPFNMVLEARV
ncbi:MAG TPA: class I SAM-dependent methyltransferase [Acidobacteriaceae bacterium]|jgi:2-polyprenyl-3-methyl-5-hydroxy-6-metoxy-1,4-benzoquinol methylase|nr:class I SAM-dependent methyltransferase [Acidobacteriaceae bacterium]